MNTTHSTPTYDIHQRAKTPFEILREDYFNSLLEDEMKWCRNLDDVGKYTYLNQTMIKPQSIVNFSTRYQRRRYNAKSLDNLVQNQDKRPIDPALYTPGFVAPASASSGTPTWNIGGSGKTSDGVDWNIGASKSEEDHTMKLALLGLLGLVAYKVLIKK